MANVQDVAAYILSKLKTMTAIKLQKLVYLSIFIHHKIMLFIYNWEKHY